MIKFKHCAILGQTQTGKSTKAKQICRDYYAEGRGTAVLDPMTDEWAEWDCDFITDDPDLFLDYLMNKATGCAAFVDESLLALEKDSRFDWLTTTGRHREHEIYLISHRIEGLSKNMRMCCIQLYLFNVDFDSARDLARLFNRPELKEAAALPQGKYIYTERMSGFVEYGDVFEEVYGQNDTDYEEPESEESITYEED